MHLHFILCVNGELYWMPFFNVDHCVTLDLTIYEYMYMYFSFFCYRCKSSLEEIEALQKRANELEPVCSMFFVYLIKD